ncbi:hypothetical protein HY623_02720 [Candidatus Uhrbacteria bacterium]|nr:hypothetical protein [Candidatus Uhrbacteria bacterium]
MHLKRNVIGALCTLLLFGAILFVAVPYVLFAVTKTVPLSELKWEKDPSVIALAPITRDGKEGTLIIRLLDGDDHFFDGQARVFHMSENSLVLVPKDIPQDYQGELPLYYIEHGRKIFQLKFVYRFGTIVNVTENLQRTYLAIESYNGKSTQFCVIERITDMKQPTCQQIDVTQTMRSLWNPNHDHELLIQTSDNEIVTFDPWDKRPHRIREDGDAKRFADLLAAINSQKRERVIFSEGSLHRFLSVVLRVTPSGWRLIAVPPFSQVSWLSDIEHILVQEGGRLWVIEYATNRKSEITLPSSDASLQ